VINGEVKNYQNVKKHDKHTEEEMWGAWHKIIDFYKSNWKKYNQLCTDVRGNLIKFNTF
jgi:hypothetical protein